MTITLYQFQKRENSTARPSGGTSFDGQIRFDCTIVSPSVVFSAQNLSGYNYAYIPLFSRWYFIRNWSFSDGLWIAEMECDTLATYRDQIGASTQYVLRSSARYNGDITDGYYPAKAKTTFETTSAFLWGTDPPIRYVVGIIGNNGDKGAVTYFSMNEQEFADFSGKLMGTTDYIGSDFGNITVDYMKTQFNPFQYVASVKAFPFTMSGDDVGTIPLGWYSIEASGREVTSDTIQAYVEFNVPKHPKSARGSFLNATPFSRYSIYHPSFGTIPLDGNILANAQKLRADLKIDPKTGEGVVNIVIDSWTYCQRPAKVGADVQIGQISADYAGYVSNGLSAFGSVFSADWAGIVKGIGNAANSLLPQVETSGQNGSFMAFKQPVYLSVEHVDIVDDDNEDRGRPLCERAVISTLPGYIVVADGDIAITGTAEEARTVKSYMEGGFFFE